MYVHTCVHALLVCVCAAGETVPESDSTWAQEVVLLLKHLSQFLGGKRKVMDVLPCVCTPFTPFQNFFPDIRPFS